MFNLKLIIPEIIENIWNNSDYKPRKTVFQPISKKN